jgi:hypothetical protein
MRNMHILFIIGTMIMIVGSLIILSTNQASAQPKGQRITNFCYDVQLPGEEPFGKCPFSNNGDCHKEQKNDPFAISSCYPYRKE